MHPDLIISMLREGFDTNGATQFYPVEHSTVAEHEPLQYSPLAMSANPFERAMDEIFIDDPLREPGFDVTHLQLEHYAYENMYRRLEFEAVFRRASNRVYFQIFPAWESRGVAVTFNQWRAWVEILSNGNALVYQFPLHIRRRPMFTLDRTETRWRWGMEPSRFVDVRMNIRLMQMPWYCRTVGKV